MGRLGLFHAGNMILADAEAAVQLFLGQTLFLAPASKELRFLCRGTDQTLPGPRNFNIPNIFSVNCLWGGPAKAQLVYFWNDLFCLKKSGRLDNPGRMKL